MFQRNYALYSGFLEQVAALAVSRRAFWEHPKTRAFQARWELPVYITSLSLDLMTSQISQLLRKPGESDRESDRETTGGSTSPR